MQLLHTLLMQHLPIPVKLCRLEQNMCTLEACKSTLQEHLPNLTRKELPPKLTLKGQLPKLIPKEHPL